MDLVDSGFCQTLDQSAQVSWSPPGSAVGWVPVCLTCSSSPKNGKKYH